MYRLSAAARGATRHQQPTDKSAQSQSSLKRQARSLHVKVTRTNRGRVGLRFGIGIARVWIAHKLVGQYRSGRFVSERVHISMTRPAFLRPQPDGVLLAIKLQPRASANEVGSPLGQELKVKVTAPPVDDAANQALVRLLADYFDCGRNRVELVRGHTSRHKVIKILGLSEAAVTARLEST